MDYLHSKIKVTHSFEKGLMYIFNVNGVDSCGDIVLDLLEEHRLNDATKYFDEGKRRISVDKKWFTDEPKRIIEKILH